MPTEIKSTVTDEAIEEVLDRWGCLFAERTAMRDMAKEAALLQTQLEIAVEALSGSVSEYNEARRSGLDADQAFSCVLELNEKALAAIKSIGKESNG